MTSYQRQWEQFKAQTPNHAIKVLHHDGLYRHVRMQAPGTRMWSWDVITWPGYLTTVGDVANGYTFTRIPDMFNFFESTTRGTDEPPYINPSYWSEKLTAGRNSIRRWSPELFVEEVRSYAVDYELEPAEVAELVELARWSSDSEHEAYVWLRDEHRLAGFDSWEGCREFDHHFILACYAVVVTIGAWRALDFDLTASEE